MLTGFCVLFDGVVQNIKVEEVWWGLTWALAV